MRPDTVTAMQTLIDQIRDALPFDQPDAYFCSGACRACSQKILDFMDEELCDAQSALDEGHKPTLGELERLAKRAKKVEKSLLKALGITQAIK